MTPEQQAEQCRDLGSNAKVLYPYISEDNPLVVATDDLVY